MPSYLPIPNNILIIMIILYWSHQMNCSTTNNSSSNVQQQQHQSFIKLINSSSKQDQFELLLICIDNDYYNNSIIQLNLIDIDMEPLNVFTIKSDGHIEPIDNLLTMKYFTGTIMNTKWNHTIKIYSYGIINVVNGEISLLISTDSDEFYLTPSISFDKNLNTHFINENHIPHSFIVPNIYSKWNSHRHRRHSSTRYCGIKLKIDYDLFQRFNENLILTVQHSQFVIRFVNKIFFQTKWSENGYENATENHLDRFGILPCVIIIEVEEQLMNPLKPQYNWTEYIEQISDQNYCLSHVFSNVNITDLNGLTFIRRIFEKINGGLSSFAHCKNPWEIYCILSVVHEFGHNFGSPHDPETNDCMPEENGSFIMSYPFNYKKGPNNFKFSPCSNRAIYHNLESKFDDFIEMIKKGSCRNRNKCGDRIVEEGEECDEGKDGGNCCDKKCRLKPNAKCSQSQTNALCCNEKCEFRMKGEHCLPNDLNFCLNHSECDGKSYLCPDRKPLPDYTLCGDEHLDGVCHNGHCQMCSRYIEGCHFCCLEKFKKTCKPNRILPVDSKCEIKNMPGRCDYQGICQNLNSIIDTFKPSTIGPSPHPIDKFNFILSIRDIILLTIFITVFILIALVILANYLAERNLFDEYDGEFRQTLINYRRRGSPDTLVRMAIK
uniref:ADAM 17-like protease isoform X1 n=1 Tax=Dermatophagoides pteronyssinus TaxID=6956 RepID=A0A6P6YDJ3_DERPT|nr:ADAM 17-like protease isoform X1 [Dermatophagoides pteronyssinus]